MPKWLWVGLIGVALLVPAALFWIDIWTSDRVRSSDVHVAFRRLASVPISKASGDPGAEVTATVPNDASWRRIIREWGDQGFFIGAVEPGPSRRLIYCLKDLGVSVEARIGDRFVDLQPAGFPYGYSIYCAPAGLLFRAEPGSVVRIRFVVTGHPRLPADLVVEPYWGFEAKDRLVEVYLDEDLRLRGVATALGVAGAVAIAIAAYLFSHRPPQPTGQKT